jgi:hypothetical protein
MALGRELEPKKEEMRRLNRIGYNNKLLHSVLLGFSDKQG